MVGDAAPGLEAASPAWWSCSHRLRHVTLLLLIADRPRRDLAIRAALGGGSCIAAQQILEGTVWPW